MDRLERKQRHIRQILDNLERPDLLVSDVMTPAPDCIRPTQTVLELVRLLHDRAFRHLLVTDDERRLVGVISDRDVVRCFGPTQYPEQRLLESITAEDIMSRDLITANPEMRLKQAVVMMREFGINCLPVVSDGCLLGILTTTDLDLVLELLLDGWRDLKRESPSNRTLANA